jgi:hypothetical protein
MPPRKVDAEKLAAAKPLLQSIVKKDMAQLQQYMTKVNGLLKSPEAVALRICECCIQLTRPGDGGIVEKQGGAVARKR